ncbi:MAG: Vgb family protein [Candidatus Flexifilum sp.]
MAMLRNLQRLPVWQRSVIFFSILIGVILGLIGLTLLLIGESFAAAPRQQGQALVPDVTVRQFAALPDNDAYPSALAVGPDGAVYTGSFATGAMWRIEPDGTVGPELPGTRETIGAFMGVAVAADGTLIAIDQGDTDPRTLGGALWRVDPAAGTVTPFTTFVPEGGWAAPNDITIDAQGRVYVSDAGRNQIYRFEADGSGGTVWWVAPVIAGEPRTAVTGLTYDPTTDTILITEPELNRIYRVGVDGETSEVIYRHGERANPPGFDGITVASDGTIYTAALGQNGIAVVDNGDLDYIAGMFRGASDVAFAPPNRLYVTNFDQAALVLPLIQPQLPFAIDVIELSP